jgi:hypothetical protein
MTGSAIDASNPPARKDLGEERLEERPFARGQLHGRAVAADGPRGEVDLDRTVGDEWVRVAAAAARDRSDPGRELGEVKGLHEIVVRARVQPLDPVRHLVERGEHDHGRHAAPRPQALQEADNPPVGQHQVEEDEVVARPAHRVACGRRRGQPLLRADGGLAAARRRRPAGRGERRIRVDDRCHDIDGSDAESRRIEAAVHPGTLEVIDIENEDDDRDRDQVQDGLDDD